VMASSLPEGVKERLMCLSDHRITQDGVVVIKSQEHRSQDMNRIEAFARLHDLVQSVAKPPKKRKPTKPTYASKLRRLDSKKKTSAIKSNRGRVL
jgi:ribosome-associated protein